MSIRIMFRKCEHCGCSYPYNPSVGNFGKICPKCKKPQTRTINHIRKELKERIWTFTV